MQYELAGIGVLARERHQRPVVVPHGLIERQQHFAFGRAGAPLESLREREEARRDRVPEPPAAEMDADPRSAPVARPCEPTALLIVAFVLSLEAQVAVVVRFCVEASV